MPDPRRTGAGGPIRYHPGLMRCTAPLRPAAPVRAASASRGQHVTRALVALLALLVMAPPAPAQEAREIRIDGDRLSGFVLPIEPLAAETTFQSLRARVWRVDDTQRIRLDGRVIVRIGRSEFRSESAFVWINRLPSAAGPINQIAIYFDRLNDSLRPTGTSAAGRELLITASTRGGIDLTVPLVDEGAPPETAERRRAERALSLHLRRLRADLPPIAPRLTWEPGEARAGLDTRDLPERLPLPAGLDQPAWLLDPGALVSLSAGEIEFSRGDLENVITAVGGVTVEYTARQRDPSGRRPSRLTLTASRAVLFAAPGAVMEMADREVSAADLHGIYLEGAATVIADDDRYRVTAAHAYYDFRSGRAIMRDSVLRTTIRDSRRPLTARARELRQVAETEWIARRVQVAASEFHTGHLAIGAEHLRLTQSVPGADDDDAGTPRETVLDAREVTFRVDGTPVLWWPHFRGTIDQVPLNSVSLRGGSDTGIGLATNWNPWALAGTQAPDGARTDLRLDWFSKRGPATGVRHRMESGGFRSDVDLYALLDDDGEDRTTAGRRVRHDGDFRGIGAAELSWLAAPELLAQAQGAVFTDATFANAWRTGDFETRREYETSAFVRWQRDRAALTAYARYEPNDFLSNGWLLGSQAYSVDRLPEFAYRRIGDPVWSLFTVSSETRVGRVRIRPVRSTPRELGLPGAAFGLGLDDPIEDLFIAGGITTRTVTRFDTRHEVTMPFNWSWLRITPFLVGRLSAYDHDFAELSPDADTTATWGAAGIRAAARFQRIDDAVTSRILDLHRLRHIVEPSVSIWYAVGSSPEGSYPVYDLDVEGAAQGAVTRLGLRNTLQTQRGGFGQWQTVEVLTLDAAVVLASDDADRTSPIPRVFESRPELSRLGDYAEASAVWQATNALAVSGVLLYGLDDDRVLMSSAGAELRHSDVFTTYVEYRHIQPAQSELLSLGWVYRLTPTYRVSLYPQWDFREDDLRSINVRIMRSFPDFDFAIGLTYDRIRDETSVAASLNVAKF